MSALGKSSVRLQGVYTVKALREFIGSLQLTHNTIALVPTMGNLHEGHLSLMHLAREYADIVICSIFVNPTQFGLGEDFSGYPRTLMEDEALLEKQGLVHLVFAPEEKDIYPFGLDNTAKITMPGLSKELCGSGRPGHFDGVASVVLRLLNLISPDILVLGEKDYQQLILLKRLVRDLHLPVQIVSGVIHREADGLAMSTRNQYLSPAERKVAPKLYCELVKLSKLIKSGGEDCQTLVKQSLSSLEAFGFKPEYIEVRRSIDLGKPMETESPDGLIILAAAWLGNARLIDNIQL